MSTPVETISTDTALITGASSGIGDALAACFGASGHRLCWWPAAPACWKPWPTSCAPPTASRCGCWRPIWHSQVRRRHWPMQRRGHDRVLNVASITAFQPVPSLAVYAANKAYVLSLTESLAEEWAGSGCCPSGCCGASAGW